MQIDRPSEGIERQWTLQLGSQHPAGHGPIALTLQVDNPGDDATILWAEPHIVPLHRGVEKLFESRDYRQALMLADRHEWHSAFGSELGLALTIEGIAGMTVPDRASWIRTAMAELNRAIHHLRWLGETVGQLANGEASDIALRDDCRQVRDELVLRHEAMSGGRLHPMLVVPGGVREDTPVGWTANLRVDADRVTPLLGSLREWISGQADLSGVGVLTAELAESFGVTGPVARASGASLDLRLDDPYVAYSQLASSGHLQRVTASPGDAQARMQVLVDELEVSQRCLTACATELAAPSNQGPVNVRLPRSLRLPEGTGYGWTENPSGINGWLLVSRGSPMPYRLKIRTSSFANAQALCRVVVGSKVRDLPVILMSFLLVGGDLGK